MRLAVSVTRTPASGDSQIVEVVKAVVDACEGATLVRLDPGIVIVDCADPEGLELDCVRDADDDELEVEWMLVVSEPVVSDTVVAV